MVGAALPSVDECGECQEMKMGRLDKMEKQQTTVTKLPNGPFEAIGLAKHFQHCNLWLSCGSSGGPSIVITDPSQA